MSHENGKGIYVASNLLQYKRVRHTNNVLRDHGVEITYDWTPHAEELFASDAPDNRPEEELCEIGLNEVRGVAQAQFLLVLLPGGRGTHFELGQAYQKFSDELTVQFRQEGWEDYRNCAFETLPICVVMGQDDAPFRTSFHYLHDIYRVQTDDEGIDRALTYFDIERKT